jgi:hypothetical protein
MAFPGRREAGRRPRKAIVPKQIEPGRPADTSGLSVPPWDTSVSELRTRPMSTPRAHPSLYLPKVSIDAVWLPTLAKFFGYAAAADRADSPDIC